MKFTHDHARIRTADHNPLEEYVLEAEGEMSPTQTAQQVYEQFEVQMTPGDVEQMWSGEYE